MAKREKKNPGTKIKKLGLRPPAWQDILAMALLAAVFMAIPIIASPDSSSYVENAHLLFAPGGLAQWNPVRGPVLPLVLRVSYFVFGESAYGTAITFCFIYLAYALIVMHIFRLMGWTEQWGKSLSWLCAGVLLLLNPMVLTYSHYILTEFPALVLATLAFGLVLKTHILLQGGGPPPQKRRWVLAVRYGGAALLAVALFALKQMFFPLAVIPFVISEVILLAQRVTAKKLALAAGALVCVVGAVFLWSAIWGAVLKGAGRQDERYDAGTLVSSTLVDGQRYFRIQQEERGVMGVPIRIEVMDDSYRQVLSSFEYTFTGSTLDSVRYLFTCLGENPGRFFQSYVSNYRAICHLYRVVELAQDGHLAYNPVVPRQDNYFKALIDPHENSYWLRQFQKENLVRGSTLYDDRVSFPPPGPSYVQGVDSNLVTNLIFDSPYPYVAYFLYSFPASIAPFVFVLAIAMAIVFRKKEQDRRLWERIILVSGSIFLYILFLAVTASSLDRYGFPTSVLGVLLLILLVQAAIRLGGLLRGRVRAGREKAAGPKEKGAAKG